MGLLQNDSDIILDVVLTDAGRERAAKGDGSFQITKFACADDEINYELFDSTAAGGSAYYDLEILQTPIFEAWTDNGTLLKNKLVSIQRSDLLYLPVLKLNEVFSSANARRASGGSEGAFLVCVNRETEQMFTPTNGIMLGSNPAGGGSFVRVDQGLDTTQISFSRPLDDNLIETRYIIEIDNRFGQIISSDGRVRARPSSIDDDNIASYNLALGADTAFVQENTNRDDSTGQVIAGPRGTFVNFKILASLELESSTYYFDTLGSTSNVTDKTGATDGILYIDTIVRVIGATTGRVVEVPIRYARKDLNYGV